MKKNVPYFILVLIAVAAIVVLATNAKRNAAKKLDERISFHKRDKIPYGLSVAYGSLPVIFPQATVAVNKKDPGLWETQVRTNNEQVLIIISPLFDADEYEMKTILRFVEDGNDVFISAAEVSEAAQRLLHCNIEGTNLTGYFPAALLPDTLQVSLDSAFFTGTHSYLYPGKRIDTYFTTIDDSITIVKGFNAQRRPDFIQLRAGNGNLFLHLAPAALTNYFLLHQSNINYYEQVMSVLDRSATRVLWDEYFRYKRPGDERKKNWLSVLMNMQNSEGKKPFRVALLLVIGLLLLYVLIEMRRRQRRIPIISKPANETLEFTKTVGRLYHDKADHNNLARKMSAYFLEHVRSRYQLVTTDLNESFAKQLHMKTGVEQSLIDNILFTINQLDHTLMTGQQLAAFHKKLEHFYKTA